MAAHYPPDYSDQAIGARVVAAEELEELETWPTVPTWDANLEADPGIDDETAMGRLFLAFLACLLVITVAAWLAGA